MINDGDTIDVSGARTISIDGVLFSVDLLRTLIPPPGEFRIWTIEGPYSTKQSGRVTHERADVLTVQIVD